MKKADKGETGKETVLRKTASVCPECLKILSAEVFERGGKVYIRKACEEHGRIEDIYWGDYGMYKRAGGFAEDGIALENPNITKDKPVCPKDCGICRMHKSHTCLANLLQPTDAIWPAGTASFIQAGSDMCMSQALSR